VPVTVAGADTNHPESFDCKEKTIQSYGYHADVDHSIID